MALLAVVPPVPRTTGLRYMPAPLSALPVRGGMPAPSGAVLEDAVVAPLGMGGRGAPGRKAPPVYREGPSPAGAPP